MSCFLGGNAPHEPSETIRWFNMHTYEWRSSLLYPTPVADRSAWGFFVPAHVVYSRRDSLHQKMMEFHRRIHEREGRNVVYSELSVREQIYRNQSHFVELSQAIARLREEAGLASRSD